MATLLNGVETPRSNRATATPENPPDHYDTDGDGLIEIDHLAQLNAVRWDLDGDGEITAADSAYWNDGQGWEPIGAKYEPFSGIFEGNDQAIANLFIDRFEVEAQPDLFLSITNQGLFAELGTGGEIRGGEIRNLGLTQADIKGGHYVGGLGGWSFGTISGCYVTGGIVGTYDTGGLTGENFHIIRESYADVSVSGGRHAGGLVGFTEPGSIITGSYATGTVNGQRSNGGLVGHNKATISASYATGAVNGWARSGGLVGLNEGTVSASYAAGSAISQSTVGGLVGQNTGTINASYATGKATRATGDHQLGIRGLAGSNTGTITASYHDSDTSGHNDARSRTTAQLQTPTGYVGIYSDWNVDLYGDSAADNPWDFGTQQQYPALQVDFNGDGTATWQEFGHQLRLVATTSYGEIQLSWNGVNPADPITASSVTYVLYRDGAKVTGYDGSSLSYTDAAVTVGQTYTYQVATLVNGVEVRRSNTVTLEAAEGDPNRDPLVALYNATGGANWQNNANWLSDRPLDEWHGVFTDEYGQVIYLDLSANALTESIPAQMGNLGQIVGLNLGGNQLTGPIPAELGSIASLQWLSLSHNRLTGVIPSQLGSLGQLQGLYLADNGLTGYCRASWVTWRT